MKEFLDISYILFLTFLIYSGFSIANIFFGILNSITVRKEEFNWKVLLKGVSKVLAIYLVISLVVYSCMGLPYLNDQTMRVVGEPLFSETVMKGISVIGILSALATALANRAAAAIKNVVDYFAKKEN